MTRADTRTLSLEALNTRRREAVQLRLTGMKLAEVAGRTGLSAPTIITAHKAYLAGGWGAVAAKPRGRATGEGRALNPVQEAEAFRLLTSTAPDELKLPFRLWQMEAVQLLVTERFGVILPDRTAGHYLQRWGLSALRPAARIRAGGELLRRWSRSVFPGIRVRAESENGEIQWVDEISPNPPEAPGLAQAARFNIVRAVTQRGKVRWLAYEGYLRAPVLIDFFDRLIADVDRTLFVMLDGMQWQRAAAFDAWLHERTQRIHAFHLPELYASGVEGGPAPPAVPSAPGPVPVYPAQGGSLLQTQLKHLMADLQEKDRAYAAAQIKGKAKQMNLTHLQRLEAESIHILREVVAETENPVMLYSIGKDSAVMLHLARKAFYPAAPPFSLLHVDTTWKFRDMYAFRERMVKESGMSLIVYINPEGLQMGINPFIHGSAIHTDIMKTQGLRQALEKYGFDAAFGGARRDEEKSRAKERIFSFRTVQHRWDPKNQRPELWHLYNARKRSGESIRVFPLSNWTELDVWQYIHLEQIPIVPLYYAAVRPVVERDGMLIMVDDDRMPLKDGEVPMMRQVRFRTLGCYPLTGAIESSATTLPAIIQEMLLARTSERQGRVIDHDSAGSMEKKKQEGYF